MDPNNQRNSGTPQAGQPVQQAANTFTPPVYAAPTSPQVAPPVAQIGQVATQTTPQAYAPQPQVAPITPQPQTAPTKEKQPNPNSTQNSLKIAEIRDGIVIMQDGSYRSVVLCQSINFDLMSPEEREGVELSYQGFLNSLYFNIQISIRSQKVDLDTYMEKLDDIRANQDNILLGLLMEDYIAYVRYLVEAANIMDKQFYVTVPYYSGLNLEEGVKESAKKVGGVFTSFLKPKKDQVVINEDDFNKAKIELQQRVQMVLNGLGQMGVQSIPLNTQELSELYYGVYNPTSAHQQRLIDINSLETPLITKGQGEARTGDQNG